MSWLSNREDVKNVAVLMRACRYAAEMHGPQVRDGPTKTPFITHPLEVVEILCKVDNTSDMDLLCAAALHDVVEDTAATIGDVDQIFGSEVARIVAAVTDDQKESREARHERQINVMRTAPDHIRYNVMALRMADKISNLRSLQACYPCKEWPVDRAHYYISFCERVLATCRQTCGIGKDAPLMTMLAETIEKAKQKCQVEMFP